MKIIELFESIQGEGIRLGIPSLFIRTAGCNLQCSWCDTPRARDASDGREYPLDELERLACQSAVSDVVITGGEPTLYAEELTALCAALRAAGKCVTVETNATRFVACAADLISLSPKLPGSQTGGRTDTWQTEILRQYCAEAAAVQVKIVVGTAAEARRALELVTDTGIDFSRVVLMPQARTRAEHCSQAEWLVPFCLKAGVRFGARLQILLWNNEPGR